MRIPEKALILPTLYLIKKNDGISTSDLIKELTALFNPTGEDAEILDKRNDTKFSQKVRNLTSHRNYNKMALYTTLIDSVYNLTEAGEKFLDKNIIQIETLFLNKFSPETLTTAFKQQLDISETNLTNHFIYPEDTIITEGQQTTRTIIGRKRSKKLRDAAIKYYKSKSNGTLRCAVCDFCFEEHYENIGNDFIEIHHEKPIAQISDEEFEAHIDDALSSVKPLCANCHRMIHRNPQKPLTIDELKSLLK